ncbi:MAG: beta-ketoacyl-ACP synthase III [Sandaracinaceae bacterium]|nr:beta-ketoacyl-ACP synthase III [Sandaracinaceae bacterium]
MPNAYISGVGGYVPPQVVTNDDLASRYGIDTTHEWIFQRTGICERRFAEEGVGSAEMGYLAAQVALKQAGLSIHDIDLIVFATLSPDHHFPGSGCFMQRRFTELFEGDFPKYLPALDIRNQCSGFVYGLVVAAGLVQAGYAKHVLLVGSETHSAALDLTTRGRTVTSLFGDGAGAAIISATDDPRRGLRKWNLGADGRGAEALCMKIWDISKRPFVPLPQGRMGPGEIPPEQLWPQMDGKQVFRHAVEKMCMSLMSVCFEMGLSANDIDLFVFHQANMRINQLVAQQLGIPEEKMIHNIHKYGNTTAATIPLLLWEAVETGRLQPGMRVALCAFGAGFTWGSAILDW